MEREYKCTVCVYIYMGSIGVEGGNMNMQQGSMDMCNI